MGLPDKFMAAFLCGQKFIPVTGYWRADAALEQENITDENIRCFDKPYGKVI